MSANNNEEWQKLPARAASLDGEPIECTIHIRRLSGEAAIGGMAFAEAVTQRYNDSLWGWAPPSEEEQLEERRRLYDGNRRRAGKDFLFAAVMALVQTVMGILVTALSKDPWSGGVWFCWALAVCWTGFAVVEGRKWRRAAAKWKGLK